jgi:hypothetical protein
MIIMKIAYLAVFFIMFVSISSAGSLAIRSFTVGVSPGIIDLGDLGKNSTKLVDFYITTPSEETLLVRLEPENGNLEFFNKADYKDFIYNYSEESIGSWVKVINNPVEIRPSNETLETLGGLIRGKEKISFLIDVPKNAEPGYHVLYIKPMPSTSQETGGAVGSLVVAITSVGIFFNIPGDAVRKGVILDTETGNYIGNGLEIKTYFQNTGTITISADIVQKIYNESGTLVKELYSGKQYVKPKEIEVFKTLLPTTGLSLGSYDVSSNVDYTTGKAEKISTIELNAPQKTLAANQEETSYVYLFIIIIIIFVVSAIIYRKIQ